MAQPVGTLVKAMTLLNALGEKGPMGVMDLSRSLDLDKSAVSRLLTTLRSGGFVRIIDGGRYDLGLRLFELGVYLQNRMPVRKLIIPFVERLAVETEETAIAVHYDQGQIAYLYQAISRHEIRLEEPVGLRCPPWNHIAGRLILSKFTDEEVRQIWEADQKTGTNPLTDWDQCRNVLKQIKKQQIAFERGEEKAYVVVPMPTSPELTGNKRIGAGLMVGGPSYRLSQERLEEIAILAKGIAAEAAVEVGWYSK
ncbi:Transcriptional regulator KdgR [Polystyrenella longa]|uniref:Transcriptional regulator KdgR n=1 Tax=Polystyrenella longa TaxID=2528007 RepID=A0A518CUK8_9PLAN|nr:IclR family transcriptional regulator [Polystyrenella longa]QDU82898.1 Transcriptional regulator KdgR [Polystyrenella longa]